MCAERPEWHQRARCRGRTAVMFPTSTRTDVHALAEALCAGCPVAARCLAYALADPSLLGVWAGTDAREREAMRAEAARMRARA